MNWIKKTGIVIVSLLTSLFVAEVGLRLVHHKEIPTAKITNGDPEAYIDGKEYYGFIHRIALLQFYSKAAYRPVPGFNEKGISSNEIGARTKKTLDDINQKENNIIVSGGSTAWGAGVKDADLYTQFFEGVSVGVGGYLFANEFSLMRDVISKKIRIDNWVSLSGWNDVYAAYRGESYYISPDMLDFEELVHGGTANSRVFQIEKAHKSYDDHKIKLFHLIEKARSKLFPTTSKVVRSRNQNGAVLVKSTDRMAYGRFWSFFSEELKLAAYWASLNGIEFTFALQPSLYSTKKDLHPKELKMMEDYAKKFDFLSAHFDDFYPRLSSDIKALSEEYQFNFIDTDEAFRETSASDKLFVDHVHLGSKGNKVLGEFLKANLRFKY